jgi:hypothetical protein
LLAFNVFPLTQFTLYMALKSKVRSSSYRGIQCQFMDTIRYCTIGSCATNLKH